MLVIRMQRTGRKGHAQFRVVVQDSRFSPSSGRVVAYLGSYNPHAKTATIDKEKAGTYLGNGAQPSERVTKLFSSEGVKMPDWVKQPAKKERTLRNADKLRRNRPDEPVTEAPAEPAPEATTEPAPAPEAAAAPAENEEVKQTEEVAQNADEDLVAEQNEAPAKEEKAPAEPESAAEETSEETKQ